MRSVDDARIEAVVRFNGHAPDVSIEWAGGTGPQGLRAVCDCSGAGICAHVVAALEAVRVHGDAYSEAPEAEPKNVALDWLPQLTLAADSRARKIWSVFSFVPNGEGMTLSCSLFLDTPRLRGVLREGEAIATMLDQTPLDDWDEHDRSLVRDGVLGDAFGVRSSSRALAQIMFRLARHPRVRYDERPDARRHPEVLAPFAIDPRGVRLIANMRGATPVPGFETSEGRRLDAPRLVILDGPPVWIADSHGAYLLDATLDAPRAVRAIAAARDSETASLDETPSLETLAKVAPYLADEERSRFGIEDVLEATGRLVMAWRDGALVIRPQLRDVASGATVGLSANGAMATIGGRLVRFPPEESRALAERLTAAGCVPRFDGTFSLHGPERAAEFVRETLPQWPELEVELDATLGGVMAPSRLDLTVGARAPSGAEDWFELDIDVVVDEGDPLSPEELRALLSSGGRYADVRGRLIDVGALREREELLQDLLGRRQSGLAALVALRDEIHESFGHVRLPAEVEALRERVRNFSGLEVVEPPKTLANVLRHYQERGLDYLSYLANFRFGVILADEMGVGKTAVALAYLLRRKELDGPAPSLVIAPTSVTHTWLNEIAKFTPQLRALKLASGNDRSARYDEIDRFDVVITSYALARIDAEKLAQFKFRTIILDEAQNAKNPASQISKVVRSLRAEHRLALTGTPVENSLRDLWAIFAFLEPGLLGTESSFRRRFEVPIASGDQRAVSRLHARLEPFVLRRTKKDVAPELPERTEAEIVVDLSPAQRQLYRTIAEAARREILDGWDGAPHEKASMHVLAALTRLRQVCAHPGLLVKRFLEEPESSAKFEALRETIDEIRDGGHRVLVFSAFASMLRLIRDDLAKRD
ncbi:MAG: DEAD/DEAH box helicase, partial [Vulcanimicrobiaceae bacterium]